MGVECGDYNNDGRLDFHMTSYQKQWAILYRNLGGGMFEDVTHIEGAGAGTFPQVTWGSGPGRFRQRRRPRPLHRLRTSPGHGRSLG